MQTFFYGCLMIMSLIEKVIKGQSDNKVWFDCRKDVVTSSKAHDVSTKMRKVTKLGGGCINMYALNEKISGRTFINPDIPALKYGCYGE